MQFENQGNPTQWAAGINQAISQKADLIILDAGNDPKLLIPQLQPGQGGEASRSSCQPPVPER